MPLICTLVSVFGVVVDIPQQYPIGNKVQLVCYIKVQSRNTRHGNDLRELYLTRWERMTNRAARVETTAAAAEIRDDAGVREATWARKLFFSISAPLLSLVGWMNRRPTCQAHSDVAKPAYRRERFRETERRSGTNIGQDARPLHALYLTCWERITNRAARVETTAATAEIRDDTGARGPRRTSSAAQWAARVSATRSSLPSIRSKRWPTLVTRTPPSADKRSHRHHLGPELPLYRRAARKLLHRPTTRAMDAGCTSKARRQSATLQFSWGTSDACDDVRNLIDFVAVLPPGFCRSPVAHDDEHRDTDDNPGARLARFHGSGPLYEHQDRHRR